MAAATDGRLLVQVKSSVERCLSIADAYVICRTGAGIGPVDSQLLMC